MVLLWGVLHGKHCGCGLLHGKQYMSENSYSISLFFNWHISIPCFWKHINIEAWRQLAQPSHRAGPCRAAPSVETLPSCRGYVVVQQLPLEARPLRPPWGDIRSCLHICHDGYLQCHLGVGGIHVDILEPNIGEHRTGRLQRKEDSHTKRPVHSRV